MVDQPQPNPKPHPVDFIALALVIIGAGAQMAGMLPAKYSGAFMVIALAARVYTKWLGSRQDKDALDEGTQLGEELKGDVEIMQARKPEPVNPPQ